MNNNFNKAIEILKDSKLSVDEKGKIKASLMAQIAEEKTAPAKPAVSPYFSWLSIFQSRHLQVGFASLFAVIIIGSTVVVGANNSLPGDFLYPIKTNFNESFQRSLVPANDSTAQVEFETKLVEKRFVEAEQLDSKNELEGERKLQVKRAIEDQTQKAIITEIKSERDESTLQRKMSPAATAPSAEVMSTMNVDVQIANPATSTTAFSATLVATTTATTSDEATTTTADEEIRHAEDGSQPAESGVQRLLDTHKDILKKLDL